MDYITIISMLLLITIGLLTVFSSANKSGLDEVRPYFSRQFIWALLGCIVMAFTIFVDYRFIAAIAYYIYAGVLILLVVLLFTAGDNNPGTMVPKRPRDLLPYSCCATGNKCYAAFQDILFEVTHDNSPPV